MPGMLGRAVVGIDIEAVQSGIKEAVKQGRGQRIAIGVNGNPALRTVLAGIRNKPGRRLSRSDSFIKYGEIRPV